MVVTCQPGKHFQGKLIVQYLLKTQLFSSEEISQGISICANRYPRIFTTQMMFTSNCLLSGKWSDAVPDCVSCDRFGCDRFGKFTSTDKYGRYFAPQGKCGNNV